MNHQNFSPRFLILLSCTFLLLSGCFEANQTTLLTPSSQKLKIRLALTEEEKAQGLSRVKSLPENEGMIFVYSEPQVLNFWMKDCYISLDMLWLDSDGTIKQIAENVPPAPPGTPTHLIPTRSGYGQYVLELAGGASEKLRLKSGMKLTFEEDLMPLLSQAQKTQPPQ